MRNKIIRLQEEIIKLQCEISAEAKKLFPEFNACWHTIGIFWECKKSPFGRCVYHEIEDKCHDNCLFCGLPEERK